MWVVEKLGFQLENTSTCSAACHFCPYTKLDRKGGVMAMPLYRKIVDEIATIPQINSLKITGLGEPTLDRFLEDRVAYAHRTAPNVKVEVYTHGAHLPPKRFDALRDAGLSTLIFSLNAVRADQHEAIMGLKGKFDTICQNIDYAIANKGNVHIEVHAVMTGDTFTFQDAIDFNIRWGHREAGGYASCVTEGNWSGDNRVIPLRKWKPNECCDRAIGQIYVMYDGRISTCCFDPSGKQVFGDLNTQTIRESYNSAGYLTFREDHANNRADRYEICAKCTRI